MSRHESRANWCCPSCDSSDVYHTTGKRFKCESCGASIHEAVGEIGGDLHDLARRGDIVGKLADRLLETGGIAQE